LRSLPRLAGTAIAILAAWAVTGAFVATQTYTSALAYGRTGYLDTELLQMLLGTFVYALMTPFLLYFAERWPVTKGNIIPPLLKIFGPVFLFGVAHAWFDAWSPRFINDARLSPHDFMVIMVATFHPHFILGACVIGVANLRRASRENAARQIRERQIEKDLARAQLQLLQAEMQPHFLFNTLNAAAALLRSDREAAATTVFTLAALLQRSQDLGRQVSIPVLSEVEFLESYLALQKVRFSDRLSTRIVVDPAAYSVAVPSLLLQPLVENAIVHGVIGRREGGSVTVEIRRDGPRLRMEVRDDGCGADAGQLNAGEGLGLANTRGRLECLFKDEFQLQFRRAAGEFVVAVTIPAREVSSTTSAE